MAVKTANAAIAYAKGQSSKPSKNWNNLCLQFVRTCFGVAAKHPNAKKAWEATTKKHKTTNASSIPAGVPVWFKTGTVNWHVAISTGNGNCYSTDVGGRGKVGLITINGLCKAWGITLLGWSEDINGVTVYKAPAAPPKPPASKPKPKPTTPTIPVKRPVLVGTVSVRDLKEARYADPPKSGTSLGPHANQVFTMETALAKTKWLAAKYVDGHYGESTVGDGSRGYGGVKGFQKKHARASNPDGWLGKLELTKLFLLAGMRVRVTD